MKITVIPDEPVGRIRPEIYGHFAEHLGACIYEGIWVGEKSPIPNTRGIRNDVARALKIIHPSVLRWPGGCFADDYHWEDGIGPREKRPTRINVHWGNDHEPNQFGTHEFIDFCRIVGAQPYFCGNLGSGTVREMRDWVEYCNWPGGTTLSDRRRTNGSQQPFDVRYWGVGNENWGCGGNLTPEHYAHEYRRYASFMFNLGTPLYLIACGPSGNDIDWTRRFFTSLNRDFGQFRRIHGYGVHYYCGTAGTATVFTESEWYQLLRSAIQIEPLILQQRAAMDVFDPRREIGMIIDEWGTWHPPTPNTSCLWQQNTMRDALVAALSLDIFHKHADKVVMSNIAQTMNVLQALILTDGDKMALTPTYHVYEMYAEHQDATSVRALFDTEAVSWDGGGNDCVMPAIAGSASIRQSKLLVSVVNTHVDLQSEAEIQIFGDAKWRLKTARVLRSDDTHDCNVPGEEPAVLLQWQRAEGEGRKFTHTFPPASVTMLAFEAV